MVGNTKEKYNISSLEAISLKQTETVIEQIKSNSICRINDSKLLQVLITNNHIINQYDILCYKTIPLETRSSALKTREYLARGLPVVTGCVEDVFERFESDFYIEFNNDDSYIDLGCVIDWYQALVSKYGSREVLASEIRKYAYKYVDNSFTMKPVIDYIQSKSNKTEE